MRRDLPPVDPKLVDWLEEVYPDKLPRGDHIPSRERFAFLMGRQSVIRKLRQIYEKQLEESMDSDVQVS